MIDAKWLRENPDELRQALTNKGVNVNIDELVKLDQERRDNINQVDLLKQKRNEISQAVGERKRKGENAEELIAQTGELIEEIKTLDNRLKVIELALQSTLLTIPNPPHASVPVGHDPRENPVVKSWGTPLAATDFPLKNHLELGEKLGLFDFARGTKIAGPGFPLYMGQGARLERSILNFMLDLHTQKHGYTEVFPPFLVNRTSATATGQLPKMEEDMYLSNLDDLFLIPTAEVPVTNIHQDEILLEKDLPIFYTAYSACFRREAGSYGKETHGFLRVHQFNKVEMVKFVKPETSYAELETLRRDAEEVLEILGLPYRVLELVTGDLSFAAAKCYDLELWAPGEKRWLEVSSCSNFEDFQARRGNIRYRPAAGGKVQFIHTLNGSGVATARLLVAILENGQQADGRIKLPDALVPYFGAEFLD